MREVDPGPKVTGHAFMAGEFTAIAIGDRMTPPLVRGETLPDCVSDCLGRLVEDRPDDSVQGLCSTSAAKAP